MGSGITSINMPVLEYMAHTSEVVAELGQIYAEGIKRIIYQTAPHTTHHKWAYRDNMRIETAYSAGTGWITYLVAERFQWRWIEYGWTEWKTKRKFPGKQIMGNALKAYAYGSNYGRGVSIK